MASVDSGVETENDSNDSSGNGQENRRSMDQSPASNSSLRDSRSASENSFFSGRDPMPSTSQDASNSSSVHDIAGEKPQQPDTWGSFLLDEQTARAGFSNSSVFNNEARAASPPAAAEAERRPDAQQDMHVEAPAGLIFKHIRPSNGACGVGYSVDHGIRGFADRVEGHNRLKAVRRIYRSQSRQARQALIEPLTVYYERNLRRAVSANNIETVETLLNSGVNPNAADEFRRAPLHLAACRGFVQILQLLLDKGANPNQKDSMGNTALHLAACTNNVPVVTLLLKAGTDVCSLDQYGRNPLQLAQTRLKMVQALAASNPDSMQVKSEVQNVIDMMQIYLHRIGSQNREAENELLNSFSTRLTLSQTSEEVDQELRGLLASLNSLNIGKSGGKGLESVDV